MNNKKKKLAEYFISFIQNDNNRDEIYDFKILDFYWYAILFFAFTVSRLSLTYISIFISENFYFSVFYLFKWFKNLII